MKKRDANQIIVIMFSQSYPPMYHRAPEWRSCLFWTFNPFFADSLTDSAPPELNSFSLSLLLPPTIPCSTWISTPLGTSSSWASPPSAAWSYPPGSSPTLALLTQVTLRLRHARRHGRVSQHCVPYSEYDFVL